MNPLRAAPRWRYGAAVGLVLAALLAWFALRGPPPPQHARFYAFGGLTEITLNAVPRQRAEAAFAAIDQRLRRDQRAWHPWQSPSELLRLNNAITHGEPFQASPTLARLLRDAKSAWRSSNGLFDPAIGGLIAAWGFHTSDYPITTPPPTLEQISKLQKVHASMRQVSIDSHDTVRSSNPALQLDLNGLAEGEAAEQIARELHARGIRDALITVGGDVLALGRTPANPWRVAIENPGGGILASLHLRGHEALFSSGDYHKYRSIAGQRWAHVLDPRTGKPVHGVAATSVIASNAVRADAASTALMIAGPKDFVAVARRMHIGCALLLTDRGQLYLTPAMHSRTHLMADVATLTITADTGTDCAEGTH